MKSKIFGLLFLILIMAGIRTQALAFTLGYPDVSFDSTQGTGQNLFGTQGVTYNASTGLLSVSAAAQSISFDGLSSTPLIDGTLDYQVLLNSQSFNGTTVTGNFVTSGGTPADLVIKDSTGTLLTGNFSSFVMTGFTGTNIGAGVATFTVTGGSLASDFGGTGGIGGVVNLDFNISPQFTATSFNSNFSGSVKGDVAPVVPIPSSMLLMGTGLGFLTLLRLKNTKRLKISFI